MAASAGRDVAATLARRLGGIGALVTFPIAIALALVGQFALGGLIMAVSPPPEIGGQAPAADGATWAQVLLLLLQGATLIFAVSRGRIRPSRVYLALAAFVWAIASLLIIYVALQCDLAGVCL